MSMISFGIGIVAGVVDILPMVIQKMNRRSILSAFLQYFFVSIIIVHIDLPGIVWWLQGGLVSLALAIPIMIMVSAEDKKAIPVMGAMAIILGSLIGAAGHFLQ
jgi:hypothetical protein